MHATSSAGFITKTGSFQLPLPSSSSSSSLASFLHCGHRSSERRRAPQPQSLLHYCTANSIESKPHHAKLNFPTRPPRHRHRSRTEIGGTVQTASGCIDILRGRQGNNSTNSATDLRQTTTHAILRPTAPPQQSDRALKKSHDRLRFDLCRTL